MSLERKRYIASWVLLAVFLPTLLLSSLHIHHESEADEISSNSTDIFSDAFYQEEEAQPVYFASTITKEDCQTLANYYTREHNEFLLYLKARKMRISFEESCGLVVSPNPIFPTVFLYLAIIVIIASIIYGFSQDRKTRFTGSLQYLQEWTGLTKHAVIDVLKKLVEKKIIVKNDEYINKVKFCSYSYNFTSSEETTPVVKNDNKKWCKNFTGGGEETTPNNIDIDNKDNNILNDGG